MKKNIIHHNPVRIPFPYQEVETEEPIITEDEVVHLNTNGPDDTQPYDSEFVQFEGDYFVNLGHNSAAPMILMVSDSSVSILRRMEENAKGRLGDYTSSSTEICKTDQAKPSLKNFAVSWTLLL